MKKLLTQTIVSLFAFSLFAQSAFAILPPELIDVKSPFSGTKQVITGKTEAGARVTVTGGPFQIPPVTADSNGDFEITLSLTEDNLNLFQIYVSLEDEVSEFIDFEILESTEAAIEASEDLNIDVVAPNAPNVPKVTNTVDTYMYDIEGSAEPGVTVNVTGADEASAVASSSGRFVVKVRLTQNKKNTFYLEAVDAAGNVSAKTLFEITEKGETSESEDVRVVIDETTGEQSYEVEIAEPFSDIEGHPKRNYIEALRLQGVLQGYADGTVKPDAYVNRAELLKMAMLSFQINVLSQASGSPFTDVPRYSWFARFVETGKEEGVIKGYTDGTFRPETTVNRAEALKIILEASNAPYNKNPEAEYLFTDVRETAVSKWFYPYVYFLAQNNIISSKADGSIRLGDPMTRGDLAEIIVKLQYFLEN